MPPLLILTLTVVAAALSVRLFIVATVRRRSIDMVETAIADLPGAVQVDREERGLAASLMRAGYRGPSTSAIFLGATAGAAALSLAFLYLLKRLGTIENMQQSLAIVPGGVGDVMAAVAGGTGYILFAICTAAPMQVGSSLAETLRTQSDDLRDRRKLRALLLAQTLPVKLVFPLMFCFLPGIFYSTLGPVLAQLVDVVDSVLKR